MADLLKRFGTYYRPHRGLFVLDFSSAVAAGLFGTGLSDCRDSVHR